MTPPDLIARILNAGDDEHTRYLCRHAASSMVHRHAANAARVAAAREALIAAKSQIESDYDELSDADRAVVAAGSDWAIEAINRMLTTLSGEHDGTEGTKHDDSLPVAQRSGVVSDLQTVDQKAAPEVTPSLVAPEHKPDCAKLQPLIGKLGYQLHAEADCNCGAESPSVVPEGEKMTLEVIVNGQPVIVLVHPRVASLNIVSPAQPSAHSQEAEK